MIEGLDGGRYENYYPSVVKNVQTALQTEGLYGGPLSGVLDEATSNALAEYQKANNLRVSGLPTPRTREKLKRDGCPSSFRTMELRYAKAENSRVAPLEYWLASSAVKSDLTNHMRAALRWPKSSARPSGGRLRRASPRRRATPGSGNPI